MQMNIYYSLSFWIVQHESTATVLDITEVQPHRTLLWRCDAFFPTVRRRDIQNILDHAPYCMVYACMCGLMQSSYVYCLCLAHRVLFQLSSDSITEHSQLSKDIDSYFSAALCGWLLPLKACILCTEWGNRTADIIFLSCLRFEPTTSWSTVKCFITFDPCN